MGSELAEQARRLVGTTTGGVRVARDPVNLPMIHHWVQALEDRNPVYTDEAAASATRHRGLVAPPAMLQTWTMDTVGADPGDVEQEPPNPVLDLLNAAGYTSVVATDYIHEYLRELRLGDRLSRRTMAEDISEEKQTALGPGFFVTMRYDYADADGQPVGVGRMRLLKYRPPAQAREAASAEPAQPTEVTTSPPSSAGAGERARPAVNRDNAHFWAGTRRHALLIQRCTDCGLLRHPPAPMCGRCQSTGWDTVTATGRGTIHSYVVHHHPPLPGLTLPHVPVLVDLEEGIRLVSHLTGDTEAVRIGAPVEVVFSDVDDELTLPLFRITE